MEFYSAERKKELIPFANSIDGTGEYHAKWNKPGGEGQIPYDLRSVVIWTEELKYIFKE